MLLFWNLQGAIFSLLKNEPVPVLSLMFSKKMIFSQMLLQYHNLKMKYFLILLITPSGLISFMLDFSQYF